jgi:hypothetical protein
VIPSRPRHIMGNLGTSPYLIIDIIDVQGKNRIPH